MRMKYLNHRIDNTTPRRNQRLHVRITQNERQAIDRLSTDLNQDISDTIRNALYEYYERHYKDEVS